MEICSVSLKNFKIHADRFFEFRPGTNAICGENGAGKTSILEAIAWALFDHSDYTRGELIRTGAKSAQVAVNFISSADGRTYEVRRCTSRGYDLFDPQVKVNLGLRKLEDVQSWIRQHLGVPAQMDLARLFAETIGIPQGTFTADFLKRPNERKKIFDPILKVEEYRQTYDQMRDLETYAKGQVSTLTQQIENAKRQLADQDLLQRQTVQLDQEITREAAQVEQLTQAVLQHQADVHRLTAAAQQVQRIEAELRHFETQLSGKSELLVRLESDCQSARKAVELCLAKRASHQAYETAQETIQHLTQQRRQQQAALKQRDDLQNQLRAREVEISQLQGQLATFTQLKEEQQRWQAILPQQEQLEQQQQQVMQAAQQLEPFKMAQKTLSAQIVQRQSLKSRLQADMKALQAIAPQVEALPQLEQEYQRLQAQRSQIRAGQAFASELKTLVAQAQSHQAQYRQQLPVAQHLLGSRLSGSDLVFVEQVLQSGALLSQELLTALQTLLDTLSSPVTTLEEQIQVIAQQIQAMRTVQQQVAVLPHKYQQYQECHQDLQQLQQQEADCAHQLRQVPILQGQLGQIVADLKQLNDPRGQLRFIVQQLQQAKKIQAHLAKIQADLTHLHPEMNAKEQALASFQNLDAEFEAQQHIIAQQQADHQLYLLNRDQANRFRDLDPQRKAVQAELTVLQTQVQDIQAQLQQAEPHDPQQLLQLSHTLEQLKQQKAQLQGGLQPKQLQLEDLSRRITAQQAMAQQLDQDQQTLKQKQQVLQFVADARNIFNQSGPRITRYYLTEVSFEAEQLFRELLNRDEVTLRWTEDYDIQVQERGYWRSFKSLSGGEQMCAALAVRLALLKVLADVDVAFFDEPTTNMDQVRRQQLAEAISNLKAFRQIFVISHDDTFENVTEHAIRVEHPPAA